MAKRREFTNEEIKDIINLYKQKIPRKHIAMKYKCTDKVIVRILEENNIEIKKFQSHITTKNRKYNINDYYFSLENQKSNSAYILGVLASDGCVASSQNQIYIELQREDRELLEKINIELENERPVKDYLNNSKFYENSKLYFFSKQIKDDLALYNIIPNKTAYDNDFLQNIKEEYEIDFIRGLFDGDGCIKWVNGSISWQIDSTSSKTLYHIQNILKKYEIETEVVEKKDKSIVNKKVYRIYCYNYQKCSKLYSLFYQKENILYMKRKQKHFLELLLKYKTHETSSPKN